MRGSAWKSLALAGVCLLTALVVAWSAVGQRLDAFAYDLLLSVYPPARESGSSVVVALDEETFRTYGSMAHTRQPLTRGLERISRAGAKAVAVDVQLADRYDEEWDRRLSQAIESTPNLVLASTLVEDHRAEKLSWEDPRPEFSRTASLGHVHANPDRDGVSRHVLLAIAAAGHRRWALALEAFRLASGGGAIVESEETLEIGSRSIPAPRRDRRALLIRYFSHGGVERISMKDLIEQPEVASRLRDRAVFIGVTVQGGPDRLMTPSANLYGASMPGVEIHANIYETLALGEFLRPVPNYLTLAFALALAVAFAVCFHWLAGLRAFLCGFALLAAGHLVPWLLFPRNHVMPASPPAAAAWFCFLGLGTRHYLVTRRKLGAAEAQRDRYQKAVHYVTHEMRTPLTTIQGSSELMGRYALSDEKRKEITSLIHSESRRLARMVEMFLSVERLSAGELELKREPVSTADVLAACLERARPVADRKQIRLRFDRRPEAEDAVLGDREFLEYACYNLITNAIKYSPDGTDILAGVERSGDAVRVFIQDHGYGMDEQEVKRIFQKFYRTRKAQESGEAGTGIGLALVEEIVVQHGGSIEVESRVNHGSRFTLVLPRAGDRVAQSAR